MSSSETCDFYGRSFAALRAAGLPFVVGGAFALRHYTGIERDTKDIDVFVRARDLDPLLDLLGARGCETERVFDHWLAKVRCGTDFIDVIFSSGNAICPVDDDWFAHAEPSTLFGVPILLSPVEEMIWSKAFIMERERYDGADVAHLVRARGTSLDWPRLLARFGPHWRVLSAHLTLFGFVYPSERDVVPSWVMDELAGLLAVETATPAPPERVCQGTLLSRTQYEIDVRQWGYIDARLRPRGNMSVGEAHRWTAAGEREQAEQLEAAKARG